MSTILAVLLRIIAFFHGNSTVQSIKFASRLINREAGEKDEEEWRNIEFRDWSAYLLNLKSFLTTQRQSSKLSDLVECYIYTRENGWRSIY